MRIISGTAKGRILFGPKSDKIRPALDKVKQAIYNILYDVTDLNVLDLFAGTGSVGLEAISRGASRCVLVDGGQEAITLIHKNSEMCKFQDQAVILKRLIPDEIDDIFKKFGPFDLIFVDPPYDKDLVNLTLRKLLKLSPLKEGGIIIVEHSQRELIDQDLPFEIETRKYGQTCVSLLRSNAC